MRTEWKKGLWALGTATALALSGCGGGSASNSEGTLPSTVETSIEAGLFSYNLSGYYNGKIGTASSKEAGLIKTRASELMTGTLEAINTTTGESAIYPWSAYVDLDTFQMTSNKTLAFDPGIYTFNMILEKNGRQYAGSTQYEIQDTDQVAIPFAINPVIGDREINVQVVKELPRFKFQYDAGEINATATAPKLGIIVDGGSEELFTINPTTGMTETWLAMEEGNHSVGLRYYDGNVLKGKSLSSQENITVVPGEPFNMDIAALHGEAVFALGELGGEGNITVNVPSLVIEEAGALGELRTLLTYSDNNGTVIEKEISLYQAGSDYQGSVILDSIQYGTATYQLQFFDTGEPTDELLGSCVTEEVNLSATGGTSLCNLELIRRAVNSGNLVATVGVNVLTSEMEPVAGANVYVDGQFKGITGSGTFGTSGYLKLYAIAGERTFTADSGALSGTTTDTLDVLGVHNVDIGLYGSVTVGYGKPWKYDRRSLKAGGTWQTSPNRLPSTLTAAQVAVIGGSVYLFGGSGGDVIYRASVSDPTVWENTGARLPASLAAAQLILLDEYVYMFGGSGVNKIYRAHQSDPTSWVEMNGTLPLALHYSKIVIIDDYLYLVGGESGGAHLNAIYRAPVSEPDSWETTTATLPDISATGELIVFGDYVYLLGDYYQNVIYRAPLTDPLSWEEVANVLPLSLYSSQAAVLGDTVYLFGGVNGNTYKQTVYQASLSNPTVWTVSNEVLPEVSGYAQVAVVGNYIYIFGGGNNSGAQGDKIFYRELADQ